MDAEENWNNDIGEAKKYNVSQKNYPTGISREHIYMIF